MARTDLTTAVQLVKGNHGFRAGVDVMHYHVIPGSKLALYAVVPGMF
jgi:hypothetical protein